MTTEQIEFQGFPKMARWSRDIIVTEKIDGTNAHVYISQERSMFTIADNGAGLFLCAGARNGYVMPSKSMDNHGFAAWCVENASALFGLGEGRHFGEWWGAGIQRRYGLTEKRFSLFNVSRWYDTHEDGNYVSEAPELIAAPACCHVVPILIRGPNRHDAIDITLQLLRERGSYAAPKFMDPEGIIIWHTAANIGFKKTIRKDEMPKTLAERMATAGA